MNSVTGDEGVDDLNQHGRRSSRDSLNSIKFDRYLHLEITVHTKMNIVQCKTGNLLKYCDGDLSSSCDVHVKRGRDISTDFQGIIESMN